MKILKILLLFSIKNFAIDSQVVFLDHYEVQPKILFAKNYKKIFILGGGFFLIGVAIFLSRGWWHNKTSQYMLKQYNRRPSYHIGEDYRIQHGSNHETHTMQSYITAMQDKDHPEEVDHSTARDGHSPLTSINIEELSRQAMNLQEAYDIHNELNRPQSLLHTQAVPIRNGVSIRKGVPVRNEVPIRKGVPIRNGVPIRKGVPFDPAIEHAKAINLQNLYDDVSGDPISQKDHLEALRAQENIDNKNIVSQVNYR
jgi:hypothetical protein